MSTYGNFAVWAVREKQPVWADGAETRLLTHVSPMVRLKVLRREATHYLVRLPDMRQGYVSADAVASAPSSPASAMLRREAPKHEGVHAEFVRASYFTRIMAKVVDSVALWIALILVGGVVVSSGPPGAGDAGGYDAGIWITVSLVVLWGLGVLYEGIGTAFGGTFGKAMLNVSVIDASTGRAPRLTKSLLRYGAQAAANLVFLFATLWALTDARWLVAAGFTALYLAPYLMAFMNNGKTLYDTIAGTWVVQYR